MPHRRPRTGEPTSVDGFSTNAAARSGKPGRPLKDAVGERIRIYVAAGPLVLANGVRATTVREIARASCLSPGGIYHYFGSKDDLVVHGLTPEALARACTDRARDLARLLERGAAADPRRVVEAYVEKSLSMLEFVRPALHAAIELGRPELRQRLDAGLRQNSDELVTALESLNPAWRGLAEAPAEAIRRTLLALALDEGVKPAHARRQLDWLFGRLLGPPAVRRAG